MDFGQGHDGFSGLHDQEFGLAFLRAFQGQEPQTKLMSQLAGLVVFQDALVLLAGCDNCHERMLSCTGRQKIKLLLVQ